MARANDLEEHVTTIEWQKKRKCVKVKSKKMRRENNAKWLFTCRRHTEPLCSTFLMNLLLRVTPECLMNLPMSLKLEDELRMRCWLNRKEVKCSV